MDTIQHHNDTFRFWPDGYTEQKIDTLLTRVYTRNDQEVQPTTALLDGSAARRRDERVSRRLARVIPLRPTPAERGPEAA